MSEEFFTYNGQVLDTLRKAYEKKTNIQKEGNADE